MKLKNLFIGCAATAILGSGIRCFTETKATCYKEPTGIEITIESVNINVDELDKDTLVELPVYIRKNPGFIAVNLKFELDSDLYFHSDAVSPSYLEDIKGAAVEVLSDNAISVRFEAPERCICDCMIGELLIIVPEDTPIGDYSVSLLKSERNSDINIYTHNNSDACFGEESFSLLQGGIITVTDNIEAEVEYVTRHTCSCCRSGENKDGKCEGENGCCQKQDEKKSIQKSKDAMMIISEAAEKSVFYDSPLQPSAYDDSNEKKEAEKNAKKAMAEKKIKNEKVTKKLLRPITISTLLIVGAALIMEILKIR